MADATSSSLLVIEADERRQNEFRIDLRNPPSDWKEALQKHSRFQTLVFFQSTVVDPPVDGGASPPPSDVSIWDAEQVVMQLAMALRSFPHDGIVSKIQYSLCRVAELGMICMAVKDPLRAMSSSSSPRLALSFRWAKLDARAITTLCYLLESNSLEELSLEKCTIDRPSADALEESLGKNTSLRRFRCASNVDVPKDAIFLLTGIKQMMQTNRNNLVELHVSIGHNDRSIGSIFRAVTQGQHAPWSSLQRLHLSDSRMSRLAMEAVMMMCWMIDSLQDLHFNDCTFTHNALEFMHQTLSSRKILENLAIEDGIMQDSNGDVMPIEMNFSGVQVQKLSLQGTVFESEAIAQLMENIGNNPFIRSLNISDCLIDTEDNFQRMNEAFLRQNRGPSEFVIDAIDGFNDRIIESMQHNSCIKVLIIRNVAKTGLLAFAQGLINMRNVRKLSFRSCDKYLTEEFLQALEQGMEQNTSIQSLVIGRACIKDDHAKRYLPKIRYYLTINRIKRNSLMVEHDVPNGLWAHVLSKTSKEADGIYFVLTGKPDIITVAPTRKRKRRNDDP